MSKPRTRNCTAKEAGYLQILAPSFGVHDFEAPHGEGSGKHPAVRALRIVHRLLQDEWKARSDAIRRGKGASEEAEKPPSIDSA